jgi:AcrR family transcriptional regulator
MPRPYRLGQRQAAADLTRARILEAARQLLGSPEGVGGFSVDAVARQAGVARMTVYYQFRSKVGLLEAVMDDLAVRGGVVELPLVFSREDPRNALEALVGIFTRFWASDRLVMRRLRASAVLDPELEVALRARDDRRRNALRAVLGRMDGGRPEAVELLEALTSFETFDLLVEAHPPDEVAAIVYGAALAVLEREPPG